MEWRQMKGNPRYRVAEDGTVFDLQRGKELKPIYDRNMHKWMVDTITPQGHSHRNIAKAVLEAFSEDEKIVSRNIIYIDGDVNNYHLSNLRCRPKRTYEEAKAYQREYYHRMKAEPKEQQRQRLTPLMTSEQAKELKAEKYRESVHQMYKDWTEALEQRLATEDLTPFQLWCITSTIEANKKILQKYGQGTNQDR